MSRLSRKCGSLRLSTVFTFAADWEDGYATRYAPQSSAWKQRLSVMSALVNVAMNLLAAYETS
jgi:hypothetical protein